MFDFYVYADYKGLIKEYKITCDEKDTLKAHNVFAIKYPGKLVFEVTRYQLNKKDWLDSIRLDSMQRKLNENLKK